MQSPNFLYIRSTQTPFSNRAGDNYLMEIDEEILLKGIADRNQNTYRLLYEQFHAPLFRFAESYVGCPGIAEDIVQEVFIKLWENNKLKISRSLRGYLFFMTRNACLNYLRTIQIEDKNKLKLMEAQVLSESADLDMDEEIVDRIKSAIKELPEQCQKVYSLSLYGGLKYAEIAEEMGISVNSVKTQMHRAKQLLRSKLYRLRDTMILYTHLLFQR